MINACLIKNGRCLHKKRLTFVSFVFFAFLYFATSPQQVSAQGYDISNDEFSVTMPGKPEYDKKFAQALPGYHPYDVTVNNIQYFFLLMVRNRSVRKGYEHQLWTLKAHSIGYNAGFKLAAEKDGTLVEIAQDRELELNGFPGLQFRIVSSDRQPGVLRFYVTDRFIYTLRVLGATESDPAVKAFFDSFKFVPQPKKKR